MIIQDRSDVRRASLNSILLDDAWHLEALKTLRGVAPFAWITGGFVRNAIWDEVFKMPNPCVPADVDVIYLRPQRHAPLSERQIRASLFQSAPDIRWSVKDQGRMHRRSGDAPYRTLHEALKAFPDRSSAIAVRLPDDGSLEILAPYGLEDTFRGIVRPTPAGLSDSRYEAFLDRKLAGWRQRWPRLIVASAAPRQNPDREAA